MTTFGFGRLWQDSLKELPQDLLLRWWSVMHPNLLQNPQVGKPLVEPESAPSAGAGGREEGQEAGLLTYRDPESSLQVTYQFDQSSDVIVFLDISPRHVAISRVIFISYSHEDKAWLDWIYKDCLKVLEDAGDIEFWRDDDLRASQKWADEIEAVLRDSTAAILLVSQSFLDSTFISQKELPGILGEKNGDGLTFSWIAVKKVRNQSDQTWEKIRKVQALGDSDIPLEELGDPAKRTVELLEMLPRIQREVSEMLRHRSGSS